MDDDRYGWEFKWDGVRAIAYVGDGAVRLLSRNGNEMAPSYPELAVLAGRVAVPVILDGEIVALRDDRPDFEALQSRMHVRRPPAWLVRGTPVELYLFDLLYQGEEHLLGARYTERRERLAGLALTENPVRTPPWYRGDAQYVLAASLAHGLEGVVGKPLISTYHPGQRRDWIKVKNVRYAEVIICGWKAGEGRRADTIGSLLLGVHDQDRLRYVGHVGTGFTQRALADLMRRLEPLRRDTSPFGTGVPAQHARAAHWVEPRLVGEVAFTEWTGDLVLRHPSWRGLRPDKDPAQVHRASLANDLIEPERTVVSPPANPLSCCSGGVGSGCTEGNLVMRGPAASFLARRMGSSALLLGSVMLVAFIAASLVSALATFDVQALPQTAHRQLSRAPGMSIVIIGLLDARAAEADTRAIGASMRQALRDVPYRLDEAVWSDPFALTAPGGGTSPQAELAASAGLTANATLAEGTWPGPPRPGQPVPAALPAAVAAALHVAPGAVLSLRDRNTGSRLALRVTGAYRQRDPRSPYWGIDGIWTCGASAGGCFTAHGPIAVSPAAFGPAAIAVDQASWVIRPDAARMDTGSLGNLAGRIQRAEGFLQGSAGLGGLVVSGGIPAVLRATASDLTVARSLLATGTLLLLLPAAGALALAAGLLASQRAEESALLNARGAARWQLAIPALAEAIAISAAAAAAGALAGPRLAGLLAGVGPLRGTGLRLSGTPLAAWWTALAVMALCAVITVWPVLRPPRPGAVRVRAGRQRALAAAAEAGGDIALLALAALAVWELRARPAAGHPASGVDAVLVLAPALALAGVSLIPLRALPVLAGALNRFAAVSRRLGAALASWEISRRPVRQAGPALLAVLAVATGTLAFAGYQSWRQSAQDQAAFAAGADVRVDPDEPVPVGLAATVGRAPGVTAATPVTDVPSASGSSGSSGSGADLIAVDARTGPATVLLRPDLSPVPVPALWRRITSPRRQGVALPGRPARLEITASLSGGSAAAAVLSVQDASGAVYPVPAGSLPADGRSHGLIATLSPTRQAIYPLRLLGLSLAYAVPPGTGQRPGSARPVTLTIGGIAGAPAATGAFPAPFADGSALAGWRPAVSAPGLPARAWPAVVGWRTAAGARLLTFRPGYAASAVTGTVTIAAPADTGVIPAIATRAFLRDSQVTVGSVVSVSAGPVPVPVRVVAEVAEFPTVTGGGALIVDQAAVQGLLASRHDPPLPVTSWWLSTRAGRVPPGMPPGASVTDRASQASALLGDSLSAAPQQAGLAVADAAVLLAVLGFAISVTASMRARRTQTALLAALGVPRSTQAGHLCLEELLLSLPAAAIGLLAGTGLAHLLVPAVTLTPAATAPIPPVLVEIPAGWVAALAAAVAVLPVLAAAATAARRPDPAPRLRVTEAA